MTLLIVGVTADGRHIVRNEKGVSWHTTEELEAEAARQDELAKDHTALASQIRQQLSIANSEP